MKFEKGDTVSFYKKNKKKYNIYILNYIIYGEPSPIFYRIGNIDLVRKREENTIPLMPLDAANESIRSCKMLLTEKISKNELC